MLKYFVYTANFISFLFLFIRLNRRKNLRNEGTKLLIVVSSWQMTPVPFLTLIYGKLFQKIGVEVEILHLEGNFSKSNIGAILENRCIRLAIYFSGMCVIKKSAEHGSTLVTYVLENYAKLNAIWQLKSEYSLSQAKEEKRQLKELENFDKQLAEYSMNQYDMVFVGGGVTGPSGLVYEVCKQQDVQICTFDSSTSEKILFCSNGRAPKLDDLPDSLNLVRIQSSGMRQYLQTQADQEIEKRMRGADTFKYQLETSAMEGTKFDIGIFMNSTWDGAVLGSNRLFDGNLDWLRQTLHHIINNTNYTVIIRQHPAEAHPHMKSNVDYSKELASYLKNNRVRFIKADEKVNSYSILKNVHSVIFSTSTIGLEAAIFGKPVLTPSESYITKAKLLSVPNSHQDYFGIIDTLPKISPINIDKAKELYALSQSYNWISTQLNCNNIQRWWRMNEGQLLNCGGVQLVLQSAMQKQPPSYLKLLNGFINE